MQRFISLKVCITSQNYTSMLNKTKTAIIFFRPSDGTSLLRKGDEEKIMSDLDISRALTSEVKISIRCSVFKFTYPLSPYKTKSSNVIFFQSKGK